MRRLLFLSLLLLVHPAWADSGQQRAVAAGRGLVGTPAPRLVLQTIDGQAIDLGKLYGKKAVYLKFWATWCVPCREQMPHFERTFEQAGSDLAVIAIDVGFEDSVAQVRKYRHDVGLKMPIVFDADGTLGGAFRLRVTPQHVVIGRDGRIAFVGHEVNAALERALAAARHADAPPSVAGKEASSARRHERVSADARRPAAVAQAENAPARGSPRASVATRRPRAAAQADVSPARQDARGRLPPLAVATLDGGLFPLGAGAPAQPTVLVFLSPWCESYLADSRPAVAAACRRMREQVTALSGTPGVRWLGIASGLWAERADVETWRARHRIPVPLALDADGALFRRFGVMRVPTVLLADAQGRIVRRLEGQADLAAALRPLLDAGRSR